MRECTETYQVQCNVLTLSCVVIQAKIHVTGFNLLNISFTWHVRTKTFRFLYYRYNGGNNNMYVNFIMHALLTYFTANAGYVMHCRLRLFKRCESVFSLHSV